MTPEQIIEREFRKAIGNDDKASITVTMPEGSEEVHVAYLGELFICDCDSDEVFEFVPVSHVLRFTISFPIPADWFPERFA